MLARWELLLAAAAVIAAFWRQAKGLAAWARSWIIVTRRTDHDTGMLLLSYFEATLRRQASRDPTYGSTRVFVRPLERIYRVVYQALGGGKQTFWRGVRPIWFDAQTSNQMEAPTSGNRQYNFRFSYFRGSFDLEQLLVAASDWEDSVRLGLGRQATRFRVHYHYGTSFTGELLRGQGKEPPLLSKFAVDDEAVWSVTGACRLLRWSPDDVGTSVVSTLDSLSLRPELAEFADEIKHWLMDQQWYLRRGIPWRLGCLLHGTPGTGKTSFARAIAEELDLPVHVFDLASMSNQDLKQAWRAMLTMAPCMALLEDLDAVFKGRVNVSPQQAMGGGGVTFDCLLNCIDGIERVDGVLLIVTTNHREVLDDALVDRPGRVDISIEFQSLDAAGRMKMAMRILDDATLAAKVVATGAADSAARFQRRCCALALACRFGRAPLDDTEVAS